MSFLIIIYTIDYNIIVKKNIISHKKYDSSQKIVIPNENVGYIFSWLHIYDYKKIVIIINIITRYDEQNKILLYILYVLRLLYNTDIFSHIYIRKRNDIKYRIIVLSTSCYSIHNIS